ncbi:hypothetical protein PHAVU_008G087901 [Phaseolus vulgaris]
MMQLLLVLFPIQGASPSTVSTEAQSTVDQSNINSSSPGESSSTPKASNSAIVLSETRSQIEEEEEDEFAQLARRQAQPVISNGAATGSSENSVNISTKTPHVPNPSTSVPSNALVISNPAAPVSTAKDQDIIDLLGITLSMTPSPQTTYAPSASSQGMHLISVQSTTEGFSFASHTCPENLSYNSYVVPWSQHQSKSEFQPQPQQQTHQSSSPPSSRHTHYESEQRASPTSPTGAVATTSTSSI